MLRILFCQCECSVCNLLSIRSKNCKFDAMNLWLNTFARLEINCGGTLMIPDNWLSYIAAGVTLVSGIVGFFWAKSGKNDKVGGVGWVAFSLLVVGGLVAIVQVYREGLSAAASEAKAAAANARAEQLSDDLRRTQFATTALIGGFDLSGKVSSGTFYFELADEKLDVAYAPEGFIGPLPALPKDGSADFELWLDGIYSQIVHITPSGSGLALRFDTDDRQPFLLRRENNDFSMTGPELTKKEQRASSRAMRPIPEVWFSGLSVGSAAPTVSLVDPSDIGKPSDETPDSRLYGFSFDADGEYRRLISRLVRQKQFGRITIRYPSVQEAVISEIERGFAKVRPELVFAPPLIKETDVCESSFIRVPMVIRKVAVLNKSVIVFDLVPAQQGIEAEICENPD